MMSMARKLTPTGYFADSRQTALYVVNTAVDAFPSIQTATVSTSGTTMTLAFSEAITIGAGGSGGFVVSLSGGAATLTYSFGDGTASLTYTISRTVYQGETGTLAYTQPGNGLEDSAGNDLATFSGQSITNSSSQSSDTVAPTVSSATINTDGTQITFALSEAVTFGVNGNTGFALTLSGGAVTATYVSGSGTSSLVYSLSRIIDGDETGTHAYTQFGAGVVDTATTPNPLASYTGALITNNSTVGDVVTPPVVVITPQIGDKFTFYVQPNSSVRDFYAETNEGEINTILIDFSAAADVKGTSVSSVAWSDDGGNGSISGQVLSSSVATALLTTTDSGRSRIKVTATMADGQKSVVYLHVRTRGYMHGGDYW